MDGNVSEARLIVRGDIQTLQTTYMMGSLSSMKILQVCNNVA
jgi:hypothetical protein